MNIDLYRFGSYEHSKSLLQGNLYMNSLGYFWSEEWKEKDGIWVRDGNDDGRVDIMEGIVETQEPHDSSIGFPSELLNNLCAPILSRAEAMQYCNLLCFYAHRYDFRTMRVESVDSRMEKLGPYAVRIHNVDAFLNKVYVKAEQLGDICVSGPVSYFRRDELIEKPDCFWKSKKYSYQQEWRIAYLHKYEHLKSLARKEGAGYGWEFYRKPFKLHIGSLEGIADLVSAETIFNNIESLYPGMTSVKGFMMPPIPSENMFSGWDREVFRNRVLSIDGGRYRPIFTIG